MQEPRHLVAVYGTLKSGYRLNKYINQTGTTTFITNGFLNANIYTNGSFPAIKTGEDKVFVRFMKSIVILLTLWITLKAMALYTKEEFQKYLLKKIAIQFMHGLIS